MKTKLHTYFTFILITFSITNIFGQLSYSTDWKKYRKEIIVQVGVSQFLGDLGGKDKIGTNYSPVDLEFSLTRPAISAAYRYKFYKNFNIHSSFNYLLVAGDDKLTKEPFRNNRNLNFKSNIFELATRLELSFFKKKSGHRYGIAKTMGRRVSTYSYEILGFVGIGAFYFNPKGKSPVNGEYIPLRPLHTEGQGLPGGPKQYSKVSVSIPMGVAFRMILQKKWSVGLELNYRKTFTDYIDDVSTVYYNKFDLQQAYGSNSVIMSDPSLGKIPGATSPDGAGNSAQRGNVQKDSYMSMQITLGHFIARKKSKARLRSKF